MTAHARHSTDVADLRCAIAVLERLVRDEFPTGPVEAAAIWGAASEEEIAAMRRVGLQ